MGKHIGYMVWALVDEDRQEKLKRLFSFAYINLPIRILPSIIFLFILFHKVKCVYSASIYEF